MKINYYLLLLYAILSTQNAASQNLTIPDSNFKLKLLSANSSNGIALDIDGNSLTIDTNNDGEIQVSESIAVSHLNVSSAGIVSLEGIKTFPNLTGFVADFNLLTSLDVSDSSTIQNVSAKSNLLTEVDLSGTNLVNINLSSNLLASIDLSSCTLLDNLRIQYNQLASLDIASNPLLSHISCYNNWITELDTSQSEELYVLYCSNNLMSELDLSANPSLIFVECSNNLLTELDATNNPSLALLICNQNLLPTISFGDMDSLVQLSCNNNLITSLDLSTAPELNSINCNNNLLTTLDLNANTNISDISCSNNLLTALYIKNDKIESTINFENNPLLLTICADGSQITDLQQLVFVYGYLNCSITECALDTIDHASNTLTFFPNPVKDILHINTSEMVKTIVLFDMNGKNMQLPQSKNQLDMSSLAKGIYVVEVGTDSGLTRTKIIK